MGMTRATSGPVRCPWCARPVSDGPDRPEVCPSCGVPLARPDAEQPTPVPVARPRSRGRRSQRLRAAAAILGLTSLVMAIAALAVAPAVLRQGHDDQRAQNTLVVVLRAAEQVRRDSGAFDLAQPAALAAKLSPLSVVDGLTASDGPAQVSMKVAGDGWYGAVRSATGRCFAAASLSGDPRMLQAVLPGNCTGDAARAALMPLGTAGNSTISAGAPAGPANPT